MKKILTILFLLLNNYICFAGGGNQNLPVTAIVPNHITVGTEVFIGYDRGRFPCIESFPNFQGLFDYVEIDENNNMEITVAGFGQFPCFDFSTSIEQFQFFSLGELPVGNYSIQMYWADTSTPLPVPQNLNRGLIGEVIQFEVFAPIVVPSSNYYTLALLALVMLTIAAYFIKRKPKKLMVSMLFLVVFSQQLAAKTFHILLSAADGAPSAELLVNESSTSPAPPSYSLSAFNSNPPESVKYLIPERPIGNLLNLVTGAPDWSLAKLFRYLIVIYPDSVDEAVILSSFSNDPFVLVAGAVDAYDAEQVVNVVTVNKNNIKTKGQNKAVGTFLDDLNIHAAWELSEGMGYIGALDLGLQVDHPDFMAFDNSGNYLGGNLLGGFYQFDYGDIDLNVDANEPLNTNNSSLLEDCDLDDGVDDNLATSKLLGHGSHITGIMTGKNNNIGGICKNCGMSMMKVSRFYGCQSYNGGFTLSPGSFISAQVPAIRALTRLGIGTINWSGGFGNNPNFCLVDKTGLCDALDYARKHNVMFVASAGNHRQYIQFPANLVGTVAVGGLMVIDDNGVDALQYWNESPNNGDVFDFSDTSSCPLSNGRECGSNTSCTGVNTDCVADVEYTPINQRLDVMAQAKNINSTFYLGGEWAAYIGCTDIQDGVIDGYGKCTGTSMSAPQVAAIVQLMRSTNPLLPNGTYDPTKTYGLINILNASASRSVNGLGINNFFGYGIPDARLALEMILGKSNGVQIKTRLTPMFTNISTVDNNNVYTPFPQVAVAFMLNNGAGYSPDTSKSLVAEFSEFWYDANYITIDVPRAEFYVFTTNNNPFSGVKDLVPLRRMDKKVAGNRNDTYAVSTTEIEAFHADSYNYDGIEGYILPTCSPTPSCIPTGAIALYRNEADSLNHKLVPTNTAPPTSTLLGYVYLNQDTDGDGLIDGQEIILGTNINLADTDGDGMSDSFEYPPAGVPFSDPLISDIIFEDGFE